MENLLTLYFESSDVLIKHEQHWQKPSTMLTIGICRFDIRQEQFILDRLSNFGSARIFRWLQLLFKCVYFAAGDPDCGPSAIPSANVADRV